MRRRWSAASKVFAILSVASALGAFGLVRAYELRLARLRPEVGPLVPVLEAARSLSRGTILVADMVKAATVPRAYRPGGAIASLDQVLGRTLVSDLDPGEILTRTRVQVRGGPVASQVPPGLRAFAVPSGMPPGAVRAGDRVDVLATFGGPRAHTETVASGLEVLMVLEEGSPAFGPDAPGPSLVLIVTPEQAEELAYAASFATFSFSLEPVEGAPAG